MYEAFGFAIELETCLLPLLAVAGADLFEGRVVDKVFAVVAEDEAVGRFRGCDCCQRVLHRAGQYICALQNG